MVDTTMGSPNPASSQDERDLLNFLSALATSMEKLERPAEVCVYIAAASMPYWSRDIRERALKQFIGYLDLPEITMVSLWRWYDEGRPDEEEQVLDWAVARSRECAGALRACVQAREAALLAATGNSTTSVAGAAPTPSDFQSEPEGAL